MDLVEEQFHYPVLPCEKIVWRLVRKSDWDKDAGDLLPQSYFRRPPTESTVGDTDGLSVMLVDYGELSAFEAAAGRSKMGGIVTLHVGRIRALGLDVVQNKHDHANITYVPFYYESDKNVERKAKVERLAGRLVQMSRPNKRTRA